MSEDGQAEAVDVLDEMLMRLRNEVIDLEHTVFTQTAEIDDLNTALFEAKRLDKDAFYNQTEAEDLHDMRQDLLSAQDDLEEAKKDLDNVKNGLEEAYSELVQSNEGILNLKAELDKVQREFDTYKDDAEHKIFDLECQLDKVRKLVPVAVPIAKTQTGTGTTASVGPLSWVASRLVYRDLAKRIGMDDLTGMPDLLLQDPSRSAGHEYDYTNTELSWFTKKKFTYCNICGNFTGSSFDGKRAHIKACQTHPHNFLKKSQIANPNNRGAQNSRFDLSQVPQTPSKAQSLTPGIISAGTSTWRDITPTNDDNGGTTVAGSPSVTTKRRRDSWKTEGDAAGPSKRARV